MAGVNILAGSTLGGGTRVNWQASFETPAHVRREWATEHGLPAIASEQYDRALRAVCTRLGVTTGAVTFKFKLSSVLSLCGLCSASRVGPSRSPWRF